MEEIKRKEPPSSLSSERTYSEGKKLILRRYPRYKNDVIMLWDSVRTSGYTRLYTNMLIVIQKLVKSEIEKRRPHKPKPYERAAYPVQKIKIDVKFVLIYCILNGQKYYRYTAIDECTRFFREMHDGTAHTVPKTL